MLDYAGPPSGPSALSAFWLAGSFLLPGIQRDESASQWRTAGRWLIVWGLILGVAYAVVFRGTWKWFGEYYFIRFVPMAVVLAVDLAWGGYFLVAAFASCIDRRDAIVSATPPGLRAIIALIAVAILKYALLLSLPIGEADWPGWRARLRFLYPYAIYRPLVLMPLWGRWGMMMAMCIGRLAPSASLRLRSMGQGVRMSRILLYWGGITLLTVLYSSGSAGDLARGVVIGMAVMLATYLVSFALSRGHQGQNEVTVGTTGLAAELAFLILYLPVIADIFRN